MQQELLLAAIALLAAAVLVSSFLLWKAGPLHQKAQGVDPGLPHQKAQRVDPGLPHQKAQRVDPELPHQKAQREFLHRLAQGVEPEVPLQKAQRVGPRIEHEFKRVFMTTTKEGKEALIKRWMARQKCGRLEAMRLAVEEWRRENR
jgi:hypothetical protein